MLRPDKSITQHVRSLLDCYLHSTRRQSHSIIHRHHGTACRQRPLPPLRSLRHRLVLVCSAREQSSTSWPATPNSAGKRIKGWRIQQYPQWRLSDRTRDCPQARKCHGQVRPEANLQPARIGTDNCFSPYQGGIRSRGMESAAHDLRTLSRETYAGREGGAAILRTPVPTIIPMVRYLAYHVKRKAIMVRRRLTALAVEIVPNTLGRCWQNILPRYLPGQQHPCGGAWCTTLSTNASRSQNSTARTLGTHTTAGVEKTRRRKRPRVKAAAAHSTRS